MINIGSGPVHVVGVWEQQCMLCVCMYVCVFVSCVALVHVLKHFSSISVAFLLYSVSGG